jgi:hypothetical protein
LREQIQHFFNNGSGAEKVPVLNLWKAFLFGGLSPAFAEAASRRQAAK